MFTRSAIYLVLLIICNISTVLFYVLLASIYLFIYNTDPLN